MSERVHALFVHVGSQTTRQSRAFLSPSPSVQAALACKHICELCSTCATSLDCCKTSSIALIAPSRLSSVTLRSLRHTSSSRDHRRWRRFISPRCHSQARARACVASCTRSRAGWSRRRSRCGLRRPWALLRSPLPTPCAAPRPLSPARRVTPLRALAPWCTASRLRATRWMNNLHVQANNIDVFRTAISGCLAANHSSYCVYYWRVLQL
jgi:hypothetical protein